MTAALLTAGTKNRSAQTIADFLDQSGARISATAAPDDVIVSARGLSSDTDSLLALLADEIQNPLFPDRPQRRAGRRSRRVHSARNPVSVNGDDPLRSRIYALDTPYSRSSARDEPLRSPRIADVWDFYHRYYRPQSGIIGIAGDVDAAHLRSVLTQAFGDWRPGGDDPAPALPEARFNSELYANAGRSPAPAIVDRPGAEETVLLFGVPGVRRTDPDYLALFVANQVSAAASMPASIRDCARRTATPTRRDRP